jgi:O-methyltransferase
MKEIYRIDNNIFYHAIWQDRSHLQKYKHSVILPKNTFSPWENDSEFIELYGKINGSHTLVDKYRCFELWSIGKQLSKKEGAVIEVGVWRGGTALLLCKAFTSNTTIYLCDTFEGVVKASDKDTLYKGGEHADTSEQIVVELLETNKVSNFHIIKGIFPEKATDAVSGEQFKFCHIDVDVYQSAKDIFEWVWPKMIRGGMVVFDDYGFAACEGITTLVNELTLQYPDSLFIYNINGHGILIKI